MRTKYEFRQKALEFARKEGFDALSVQGCYENYEVYLAYCKKWKENPPVIGFPQLILVNENEVKSICSMESFLIMDACKKKK